MDLQFSSEDLFIIPVMNKIDQQFGNEYAVSAKSICTEKIFFKKTLFLKSKYYPANHWIDESI